MEKLLREEVRVLVQVWHGRRKECRADGGEETGLCDMLSTNPAAAKGNIYEYHGRIHVAIVFRQKLIIKLLSCFSINRPEPLSRIRYVPVGNSRLLEYGQDFLDRFIEVCVARSGYLLFSMMISRMIKTHLQLGVLCSYGLRLTVLPWCVGCGHVPRILKRGKGERIFGR